MSLTDFLTSLSQQHEGAIPFEVFMREALYHPDFGYYTANIRTVGRGGDFSTSSTLLPDLAKAIATWIQEEQTDHRDGGGDVTNLIEIGPGDGTLLFKAMRHLHHRVRRTLTVHLVEISPKLEALQRERLAKFGNIHWHRDIHSALAAAGNRALLYSNELVDAFPATALRHKGETNEWEEIHLSFSKESGLKELFAPFTPPDCHPERSQSGVEMRSRYLRGSDRVDKPHKLPTTLNSPDSDRQTHSFSLLARTFPPTQRIELHRTYHDWLATWLPQLEAGSLLTIDYGELAENLYERRPLGTLRAYYKQQRFEGPPEIYARFGKQDLTADVNFTDLRAWGEAHGLETLSLATQAEFTGSPEPAAAAFQVLRQRRA